jgi:hypothetical protein
MRMGYSPFLPLCRNGMLQPMNYLGCAVADDMQHNPQQFILAATLN